MNLHEYQAKQLLTQYGLPVPHGEVAWNAEEAVEVAAQHWRQSLGGESASSCGWPRKSRRCKNCR